jgi:hypothetical protein
VSIPYSEGEGKSRVVSGQESVVNGEPVEKVDDVSVVSEFN